MTRAKYFLINEYTIVLVLQVPDIFKSLALVCSRNYLGKLTWVDSIFHILFLNVVVRFCISHHLKQSACGNI